MCLPVWWMHRTDRAGPMEYPVDPGPGLRVLGNDNDPPWYGSGGCYVCGSSGPDLIPRAVRFWDPDDGWRIGVLCSYCAGDCAMRGPHENDYAYCKAGMADGIAAVVEACAGDMDGTAALLEDMDL